MGFLAPYTIQSKILLQGMWASGYGWDELLDPNLSQQVKKWFGELTDLDKIRVLRCLRVRTEGMVTSGSLHTFSDASEEAYGAVSYIRYQYSSGAISLHFVAAKARVTPLSLISIPRLELMGAVMGLRLTTAISPVLDVEISQVVLWTDSMNVLWWIRNRSHKFKAFVANRVGEIQSVTSPEQWRYVPIESNPADYVTRDLTASELVQKVTWWKGPSFLAKSEAEWPKNRIEQTTFAEKEKKK